MIDDVLEQRASRYGTFKDHAKISQSLQKVLWDSPNWKDVPLDTRQAFVVICDKMARALNGDPEYDDNLVDIIGYATLILNRIRQDERDTKIDSGVSTNPDNSQIWNAKAPINAVGLNKSVTPGYGTEDNTE